jgi:hypothetical protein
LASLVFEKPKDLMAGIVPTIPLAFYCFRTSTMFRKSGTVIGVPSRFSSTV